MFSNHRKIFEKIKFKNIRAKNSNEMFDLEKNKHKNIKGNINCIKNNSTTNISSLSFSI